MPNLMFFVFMTVCLIHRLSTGSPNVFLYSCVVFAALFLGGLITITWFITNRKAHDLFKFIWKGNISIDIIRSWCHLQHQEEEKATFLVNVFANLQCACMCGGQTTYSTVVFLDYFIFDKYFWWHYLKNILTLSWFPQYPKMHFNTNLYKTHLFILCKNIIVHFII